MTEQEKMISGALYDPTDPALSAARDTAKAQCHAFNTLPPAAADQRVALLRRLFGASGEGLWIEPHFYCDYGFNIRVGEGFYANHNLVILDAAPVTFGDNVMIAPNCGFYTSEHPLDAKTRNSGREAARPISVGSNVWIGGSVCVLPGVTIGDNVVIGAGSVVARDIPSGVIAVGNPCRPVRPVPETGGAMSAPRDAVDAVVTCYNQGAMLREAVLSLCVQTVLPEKIIVVDDGSTDDATRRVLDALPHDPAVCVPLEVVRQANGGVSAARNAGLRRTDSPFVLLLDGDDRVAPAYLEQVRALLLADPTMVAASAWIRTFGVLHAVVRPTGGGIAAFLARNCCPATHILRRTAWQACRGYDETMRAGFEDWDFFLSLLETAPNAHIGIVPAPLFEYRTAPASANIQSMDKRLTLLRYLIDKHSAAFHAHLADALLGIEATAVARLAGWEDEMRRALSENGAMTERSAAFLQSPSYGDGGMAAAVRLASAFPTE